MFNGCHIFPHVYEGYSANIPGYTIKEIYEINKDDYETYFVDDVYVCAYMRSTDYYPNFIRAGEPYYLSFHALSKLKTYKKLVISSCIISSNDGCEQIIHTPIEFYFKKRIDPIDGSHAIIAKPSNGYEIETKLEKKNTKQKKINVIIHAILTEEDDNVIEKDIRFEFEKKIRFGLIDFRI